MSYRDVALCVLRFEESLMQMTRVRWRLERDVKFQNCSVFNDLRDKTFFTSHIIFQ